MIDKRDHTEHETLESGLTGRLAEAVGVDPRALEDQAEQMDIDPPEEATVTSRHPSVDERVFR